MAQSQERDTCRHCGRPRRPDERFSARGRCLDCADARFRAQAYNPTTATPDWWDRWRRGMAASIGIELPDDPPGTQT